MSLFQKFLVPGLLALALAPIAKADAVELGLNVAPRQFREDGAAPRGRLFRSGKSLPALTVQIRSTDARVIVPTTATFAEGERQLFFPIRLVNDSIVNDRASLDGFHDFHIEIGGAGIANTVIDLKILDDEPFRAPVLSKVTVSSFEALGGSSNVARLVFSGPVSFNRTASYGTPIYGIAINSLQAHITKLQVINPQVLLVTYDRDFKPGDQIGIAAYNLTDARGLPLPDQVRVAVVPEGPTYRIEASKLKFREDAGANASRVTIRLAYAMARPLTFTLRVNETNASTLPKKISAPASVTIPAGAREVSFAVAAIDNDQVDGDLLNVLSIQAPYPTPPTTPLIDFSIVDDERAPASDVRILSATRQGEGVLRLKFSGSIRNVYNIGPSADSFRVSVDGRTFRPFGSISVDTSGTVADVLTGVNLPDDQEITISVSGLRDASLAVIPDASVTLPAVPSIPTA